MLTTEEIKKQIKNGNIEITNMKKDALRKPNSCTLTIDNVLYTYDYQIVDTKNVNKYLKEIESGEIKNLRKIEIPKKGLLLEPHKVYLAKTREKVKTNGYVPILNGKNSLSLLGLSIELNSGYGEDHFDDYFMLSIVATNPIIIYSDIEIGNLTFYRSLDEVDNTVGMLSGEEIKKRMKTGDIVIKPDKNIVINPNSVNLTLFNEISYYTNPVLDMKKDNPIETVKFGEEGIILYPDKVYLARTNEWTETNNLVPMISGRSSLGRLGYHAHCSASMGSIGYKGYWHISIRTTQPLRVYPNMKCCQLYYFTPEGEIKNTYKEKTQ